MLLRLCLNFQLTSFLCSFEFGPDVYENFRVDPMAFFEQLDTMEPGEQSRSLRMIKSFIDLQEEAGGKIDFHGCVRIAFNRMMKDFRTSILDLSHSADEMEKVGRSCCCIFAQIWHCLHPHVLELYYFILPYKINTVFRQEVLDWDEAKTAPS